MEPKRSTHVYSLFFVICSLLLLLSFREIIRAESPKALQTRLAQEFSSPPCTPNTNADITITNDSSILPITLGTSAFAAGSITSLKIKGTETVDTYDLGREIQYAFQIGSSSEANNPTEAGSATRVKSTFIEGCSSRNELFTKSQMAYWIPYKGKSESDYILSKKVTLGYGGNPNLVRFIARIDVPEDSDILTLEIPTGYHSKDFSQISFFDPHSRTVRPASDTDLVKNLWGAFDLGYIGTNLIPILSNGTYSFFAYSPHIPGGIGNFYAYSSMSNGETNKWSVSTTVPSPKARSSYYFESFLLVATPDSIKPLILSLTERYPKLIIIGDLNADGSTDFSDYKIFIENFDKTGAAEFSPADIDNNGKVDIFDYNSLIANYEK